MLAIRDAVAAGIGVAQLPLWYVEGDLHRKRLVRVLGTPRSAPRSPPVDLLLGRLEGHVVDLVLRTLLARVERPDSDELLAWGLLGALVSFPVFALLL